MKHGINGQGIGKHGMICGLGLTLVLAGGCSCAKEAKQMTKNAEDALDAARMCCLDISDQDRRDQCLVDVANTTREIVGLITEWTIACNEDESDLMEEVVEAIRDRLSRDGKSCPDPDALVTMADGSLASLVSPLSTFERVDMEIGGRAGGAGARLAGTTCLFEGDASAVCAETVIKIGWLSQVDAGERSRGGSPVLTSFHIGFPDLPGTSLAMVPHPANEIVLDDRGRGSINAVMELRGPRTPGIFATAWFEFPIHVDGDWIEFGGVGMTGLEIAPQAPNAVADWNGDRVVDEFDMVDFYEDFADGPFDLDGDGEVTDADVAYFEQRFFENSNG